MKPLYELANEYQAIVEAIDNPDFPVNEEITIDLLKCLDGDRPLEAKISLEDKAINIGKIIKNLEAEENAISTAMHDMAARYKSVSNKIDRIKVYLKDNLERCNITNVKSPYFEINIRNNPKKVVIQQESLIPDVYKKEQVTISYDKLRMLQDYKLTGEIIPGVSIENGTRVEIK